MKKILSVAFLLLFPLLLHAQRTWQPQKGQNTKKTQNAKPAWRPKHNVIKFLGIPVDGSKWTIIQKLKEKGFVVVKNEKDWLEGEFNGEESYVGIKTNKNKVRWIEVQDKKNRSEEQIKARYNQLIRQFRNNNKYKEVEVEVEEISENQYFSFDTDVDNNKYGAIFLQAPWDLEMHMRQVSFKIFKQSYGQYRIAIFYENRFNEANGEDL